MILKFEDYINEGLWSKTINRSNGNEMRKENVSKYIEIFNQETYKIFQEYDIRGEYQKYLDYLLKEFNPVVKNYARKHGVVDIMNKIILPDFEYSFVIEKLDNCKINVKYIGSDKKYTMILSVKGSILDISDTKFGKNFRDMILYEVKQIIINNENLIIDTIKKYWDDFSELLYNDIYNGCLKIFNNNKKNKQSYTPLCKMYLNQYLSDKLHDDYFFGGLQFDRNTNKPDKVYLINSRFITNSKLTQNVYDVYKQAYDDAEKNV